MKLKVLLVTALLLPHAADGSQPEGNISYELGKMEAQGYYVFALRSQRPTAH